MVLEALVVVGHWIGLKAFEAFAQGVRLISSRTGGEVKHLVENAER